VVVALVPGRRPVLAGDTDSAPAQEAEVAQELVSWAGYGWCRTCPVRQLERVRALAVVHD